MVGGKTSTMTHVLPSQEKTKYLSFRITRILVFLVMGMALTQAYSFSETAYEKFLHSMKIEHVFAIPSKAYGPGAVLLYTKKGGYTRCVWPWDVIGKSENEYPNELITSESTVIQKSGNKEFEIFLNAKEIAQAKAEAGIQNITSCKIALANGFQQDIKTTFKIIYDNITSNPACRQQIILRHLQNPGSKVILVIQTFSYDIDFMVNTDKGWKASAEIPESVLKVVTAKIGIDSSSGESLALSGKGVVVGFNGDPLTPIFEAAKRLNKGPLMSSPKIAFRELEKQLLLKKPGLIDITKLFEYD
jgi:hypothetical protein